MREARRAAHADAPPRAGGAAASHKPLGAYEIIDLVAARGPRPAPITIYRALDFLTAQGLVHRIESRNAFLACINNHADGAPVVFLICEHCGKVGEAPSTAVAESLNAAAKSAGFTAKSPVIEITGVCKHCGTCSVIRSAKASESIHNCPLRVRDIRPLARNDARKTPPVRSTPSRR